MQVLYFLHQVISGHMLKSLYTFPWNIPNNTELSEPAMLTHNTNGSHPGRAAGQRTVHAMGPVVTSLKKVSLVQVWQRTLGERCALNMHTV